MQLIHRKFKKKTHKPKQNKNSILWALVYFVCHLTILQAGKQQKLISHSSRVNGQVLARASSGSHGSLTQHKGQGRPRGSLLGAPAGLIRALPK